MGKGVISHVICHGETVKATACDWLATYINRQVFPHAPSPTMTSLRRISAILYENETARQHPPDGT